MKSLKAFINEGWTAENDTWQVSNAGKGKFGYMWYDDLSGTAGVISFDKITEYAEKKGFNADEMMDIDKLKVGESAYDGYSYMCTRIW